MIRPFPRRGQDGMVLFVVLLIGIVVLIIGAVTLWMLRSHLRETGDHRKDFQSLHAAEAGTEFLRNRLNNAVFCDPWFSARDSLALLARLGDTTVRVPSAYGAPHGFSIRNAAIVPGIRPIRVRFESTGGRVLGDGSLDTADGRTVACELRMTGLTDYVRFNEMGDLVYHGTGVPDVHGKVYSGGDLVVKWTVTFHKPVKMAGDLVLDPTVASKAVFKEGSTRIPVNPYTLDHIHVSRSEPLTPCGSSISRTYEELAKGLIPDEGQGFWYSGASRGLLVDLDSIRVSAGMVRFPLRSFDSTRVGLAGPVLANVAVPASRFNGVIALDGDIFVRGTLSGLSLTLVSTDDILALHNIRCEGNELDSDRRVTLGLVSQDRFMIWGKSPTRMTLDAAIVAERDPIVNHFGYESVDPPEAAWANGDSRNCFAHPGVDEHGNPADNRDGRNWILTVNGSITAKAKAAYSCWSSATGGHGIYRFDPDLAYSPPPRFPMLRARLPGFDLWEREGMVER